MRLKMENPDCRCAVCKRTNEEVEGLIGGICQECATTAFMMFQRKDQLMDEAAKMSAERKANGTAISGGPDCTCGACVMARLLDADPVMNIIPNIVKGMMRKAEEVMPVGVSIN